MKDYYEFFVKSKLQCRLVFVFCFFCSLTLNAQNAPVKLWDKTFGGNYQDYIYSLQQTSDGGYILGGESNSYMVGDKSQGCQGYKDYWVVKIDASGNKLWDKTFGGNNFDELYSLQQTSDRGYILGGSSQSGISGDKSQAFVGPFGANDYWVVKLDSMGNKLWDKTYGGYGVDRILSLQQTLDGGYIVGGYSNSGVSGDKSQPRIGGDDFWLIKLDSIGNKLWDKTFGGVGNDVMFSLQQTTDKGFILGGYSDSGISGDKSQVSRGGRDYWVVKLDSSGTKVWDKTIGGFGDDYLTCLRQASDGGYILGGYSRSDISGEKTESTIGGPLSYDYWAVKLDASGNKIWDRTLGGNSEERLYSLTQTTDGGYLVGGNSLSGISGNKTQNLKGKNDFWVVKLNSVGNIIWDKTIGGDEDDGVNSLIRTSDGGYILGGYSGSNINGDKSQVCRGGGTDFWVVKLAAPCTSLNATLTSSCGNGGSNVSVNVTGIQPGATGTPSWTLTYTLNGVSQTVTGTSHTLELAQNAAPGTVFTLVSIVSGACSTNLTNMLTVPPIHAAPAVISVSRCGTGSVILTASGAPQGANYKWYNVATGGTAVYTNPSGTFTTPNLSVTTTYYVAVTGNGGCEGARTPVTATINILPIVYAGPDYIFCATATPYQFSSFSPVGGTWSGPGVTSGGLFTPAVGLVGTQTLTYSFTQNGCTVTDTKTITVTSPPLVKAGSADTICALAAPFQLIGFSPAGGTWSGPGVNSNGLFTPDNSLVGTQNLVYSILQNGCTTSATKIITITAPPVVSAGINDTVCANGMPVQLTGFSPAGGKWSGIGISPSGLFLPNISLVGVQTFTYSIIQYGCTFSAIKQLTVTDCSPPLIPNIITLNNDGDNDAFKPQNLPEGKWQIQIYNRLGVKLFESEDYQNNWPNTKIADGTYYYLLKNPESSQQFKGWVEVVH